MVSGNQLVPQLQKIFGRSRVRARISGRQPYNLRLPSTKLHFPLLSAKNELPHLPPPTQTNNQIGIPPNFDTRCPNLFPSPHPHFSRSPGLSFFTNTQSGHSHTHCPQTLPPWIGIAPISLLPLRLSHSPLHNSPTTSPDDSIHVQTPPHLNINVHILPNTQTALAASSTCTTPQ